MTTGTALPDFAKRLDRTAEETEALLVTSFRNLLLNTIPALEAGD